MGGKVLVPDARSGREADRGAARRRLHGRADDRPRPHRCRGGRPRDFRRRRQRQAVLHGRAHRRGLLQDARGLRAGGLARPRVRGVRGPDLVRDRQARSRLREALRRGDPGASTRTRCWRTTARRRSTGRRTSTTRRSRGSSASWARWATSSSSSRLPASTASTTRCSTSRTATRSNNMSAFVELQEAEFAAAREGLHRGAPPARSRHRLLRCGHDDGAGQPIVDDGAEPLDRGRAVLRRRRPAARGKLPTPKRAFFSDVASRAIRKGGAVSFSRDFARGGPADFPAPSSIGDHRSQRALALERDHRNVRIGLDFAAARAL